MPFTLSHPAAVLPLVGRMGTVGSALAVGSMMPDVPYFLSVGWARPLTHSLASVLWWSVPAGLVVWLAFQHLARRPALFLLPRALRERLAPAPGPLRPLAVPISLAVGALTHLAWDLATHETGPLLAGALGLDGGSAARTLDRWSYRALQHGSTLGGALGIAAWGTVWVRRTAPRGREPGDARAAWPPHWRGPLRLALVLLALGGGLVAAALLAPWRPTLDGLELLVMHVVVGAVSTGAVLLVALGLVMRVRRDRALPGSPG